MTLSTWWTKEGGKGGDNGGDGGVRDCGLCLVVEIKVGLWSYRKG